MRDLMYPAPRSVLDEVDRALRGVTDSDTRYGIREMARHSYAAGWTDGHLAGVNEAWSDQRTRSDAATAALTRRWALLHEVIHGGLADCEEVGQDGGTRCGTCLGCRIKTEVGEHD